MLLVVAWVVGVTVTDRVSLSRPVTDEDEAKDRRRSLGGGRPRDGGLGDKQSESVGINSCINWHRPTDSSWLGR